MLCEGASRRSVSSTTPGIVQQRRPAAGVGQGQAQGVPDQVGGSAWPYPENSPYGHRLDSARLPSGKESRGAWVCQVGADGYRLLDAVYAPDAPPTLCALDAVDVLRRVWIQQFMWTQGRVGWREETDLPPAAQRINSPYAPDARYGAKGDRIWIVYKAHLTETCDEERPHLVTQVETSIATGADDEALPRVQEELERRDLLPATHFADAAGLRHQYHLI